MNLFTWSFPFLVDKLAEVLEYVVKKNTMVNKNEIEKMYKRNDKDFDTMIDSLINDQVEEDEKHINKIKAKVITIGRMTQMMKQRSADSKTENTKRMSIKLNGDDRIN